MAHIGNACYGCWMVHTCSRTSVLGEVTCLTSSCVTSWKDFFCAVSMSSSASSAGRMRAHRTSICSRLALAMSTAPLDTWSAAAARNHKISTEYYLTRIYILLLSQFSYTACRQQWTSKDWWRIYWPYILRYTVSRDNGFRFVTYELFDCCVQASQWPSLSVITCRCE